MKEEGDLIESAKVRPCTLANFKTKVSDTTHNRGLALRSRWSLRAVPSKPTSFLGWVLMALPHFCLSWFLFAQKPRHRYAATKTSPTLGTLGAMWPGGF